MTNPRLASVLVAALTLAVAASAPPRAATQFRTPPGSGASPPGEAVLVDSSNSPRGFNVALAVLGGKIESKTGQHDDGEWAAENLIDGMTYVTGGRGCRPVCGWSSKDGTFPQDIVFSFYQGREALIGAIVVDTTTHEAIRWPARIAKDIEVWA